MGGWAGAGVLAGGAGGEGSCMQAGGPGGRVRWWQLGVDRGRVDGGQWCGWGECPVPGNTTREQNKLKILKARVVVGKLFY